MDRADETRVLAQIADEAFAANARFWSETYQGTDLNSVIHQDRQARADRMVSALGLAPGTHALDVGCGAGRMTAVLAERGFVVDGVDRVIEMLRLTRELADRTGVGPRVQLAVGSAAALPYASSSFGLVVALGVLPFVREVDVAIAEIVRVLEPGGFAILTASNRLRLDNLIDPAKNPFLAPVKRLARAVVAPGSKDTLRFEAVHSPADFDRLVTDARLDRVHACTVGFGPFRFFHLRLVSERRGLALHRRLQRLADSNTPVLRSTVSQYLVVAQKPPGAVGTGKHSTRRFDDHVNPQPICAQAEGPVDPSTGRNG